MKYSHLLFFASLLLCFSCKKENENAPQAVVFQATGNIAPELDRFRSVLGPLNTAPGATGGRREVNWDGVPDSLLDKPLPGDFFNPVGSAALVARQRGLQYGDAVFQVSAHSFAHLNAAAATEFTAFSGSRVFANTTALSWPVGFQVSGEKQRLP